MSESTAQLNTQSEAPTLTLDETMEIVKGFVTDNGEFPVTFKQFDVCIAAKTNTDATFVANITIRPAGEYPEADASIHSVKSVTSGVASFGSKAEGAWI